MDMRQFERWAARTRGERAPEPDVARAVMRRLRAGEPEGAQGPSIVLWLFSGASACAAAACAVLGISAWLSLNDPWQNLTQGISDWWML